MRSPRFQPIPALLLLCGMSVLSGALAFEAPVIEAPQGKQGVNAEITEVNAPDPHDFEQAKKTCVCVDCDLASADFAHFAPGSEGHQDPLVSAKPEINRCDFSGA